MFRVRTSDVPADVTAYWLKVSELTPLIDLLYQDEIIYRRVWCSLAAVLTFEPYINNLLWILFVLIFSLLFFNKEGHILILNRTHKINKNPLIFFSTYIQKKWALLLLHHIYLQMQNNHVLSCKSDGALDKWSQFSWTKYQYLFAPRCVRSTLHFFRAM